MGVVDSDYEVEARYLSETVGFFNDPALGFVQDSPRLSGAVPRRLRADVLLRSTGSFSRSGCCCERGGTQFCCTGP